MTCQKDGPRLEPAFPTQAATTTSTRVRRVLSMTEIKTTKETTLLASTEEPTTANSTSVSPTMETTHSVPTMELTSLVSATDCDDIWNQGNTENYGIYEIQPNPTCTSQSSFQVVCDLETVCGGWIVIQRRFDGSENFKRGWDDYKAGFGKLTGEHWLGLEKLHRLTRNGDWTLRVDLEDFSGNTAYAEYTNFSIGDRSTYYRLKLSDYHGTAGDSLAFNAEMAFSTYDIDHDRSRDNCAQSFQGAWWHTGCSRANLNGPYIGYPTTNTWPAMAWQDWKNNWEALKKSEMIRRT